MTSRTNVSDWVANWKELPAVEGDLIEFARTLYRHWAVYIGDGQVVHFNPAGNEFTGKSGLQQFVHGKVTYDELGKVTGNSLIRINNKPEIQATRRSLNHMRGCWKILVNKPGYTYNLQVFNCEHFATHIKFEGWSSCDQKSWLMTKSYEKVASLQWIVSGFCVARGKPAPALLIAYINYWEGPNDTTEYWQKQYLDIFNQCEEWKNLPILQLKR